MLPFRIAMRFLSSNRSQTILIVLGIAIGVSVQVFVGTLLSSLQDSLTYEIVGRSSHVTIVSISDDGSISEYDELVKISEVLDGVEVVSVATDANGFLIKGNKTLPILVRGFDYDMADGIYDLRDALYEGDLPDGEREILLGKELSEELEVGIGDTLIVSNPKGFQYNVTIVGLFDLRVEGLNSGWIMTGMQDVQEMFELGDTITGVEMQIDDVFNARSIAGDLEKSLVENGRDDVKVENWMDKNEGLLSGLKSQSASSYMIQSFVLISVMIAIASILAITVVQKSRQIGILKAMGIKDGDASKIFVFQGLFFGLFGGLLGLTIGVSLLYSFTTFATDESGEALIPINFSPAFIAGSLTIAVVISVFAAALPARRSSKLDPIEVIRNG